MDKVLKQHTNPFTVIMAKRKSSSQLVVAIRENHVKEIQFSAHENNDMLKK